MIKHWIALGLATGLAAATSASATMQQVPGPVTPVGSPPPPPSWVQQPSATEIAALYPQRARISGVAGRAKMRCRVKLDGSLTDCAIVEECPTGFGFGQATLAAARYFRMQANVNSTLLKDGQITISLPWKLGEAPLPAACATSPLH